MTKMPDSVVQLPWHPESEKPTLDFVICTNGEGHYWIGKYDESLRDKPTWGQCWLHATPTDCIDMDATGPGWCYSPDYKAPVTWCDPREFVPFEKKKAPDHLCKDDNFTCYETCTKKLALICSDSSLLSRVSFCPFCGYKAETR